MFAVYGGKGGSLKTGSRGNLNRLSPFSVSFSLILLGRIALGAQRPLVVKLSRGRSVGRSVCSSVCRLSSALWKNGRSDPAAVWHHRSDGPRMRQVVEFGIGPREGVLLGANLGRAIVTNRDFTAYVSDSAATRLSFQITMGRLAPLLLRSSSIDGCRT